MDRSITRNTALLMILAAPMMPQAWASPASHVLTFKGGTYHWADRTQETARTDVEYESTSGIFSVGFERRSRYLSLGVELMRMVSNWEAINPAATRPKGRLEMEAISFVPRKYFKPIGEFMPYVGAGVGTAWVESVYSLGLATDKHDEYGLLYQLNLGGELRWEGVGLTLEVKRMYVQIDDYTLVGDKDDFPGISGTTGLLGISFLF